MKMTLRGNVILLIVTFLTLQGCGRTPSNSDSIEPQHFTIHVESVPAYTPRGAALYLTGNFNGWNPRDPKFELESDSHGGYVIMLPDSINGPIDFKFTLGSWDTVETDNGGNDIRSRSAVAGPNRGVYVARVANWRDARKLRVRAFR